MGSENTISVGKLEVYAPFEIESSGIAQGEITTTLEKVIDALIQNGADPQRANIEKLAEGIGRSALPRVSDEQTIFSLAQKAAQHALESKEIDPKSIDLLIFATSTADNWVPDPSKEMHSLLNLKEYCQTYTMVDACQSGLDAMLEAGFKIGNRQPGIKRALVVASEVLSPRLNPADVDTNVIFSDLASAVVLGPSDDGNSGLVLDGVVTKSESKHALQLGPSLRAEDQMRMIPKIVGGAIAELAGLAVKRAITYGNPQLEELNTGITDEELLTKADLSELQVVASHQASSRMVGGIEKRLVRHGGIPKASVLDYFHVFGNGSSATSLRAMHEILISGLIHEEKDMGVFSAGVGSTARFAVIR